MNTKDNAQAMDAKDNVQAMSETDLEQVAGGTVGEFSDLVSAISAGPYANSIAEAALAHVPGLNAGFRELVTASLEKNYKIKANISLGYLGLGIDSDPNTYTDMTTGKSLTHAEVLKRIKG